MGFDWLFRFSILPIIGGLIAASGFIIAKKPDAENLLKKLAPYQGWIGVVMLGDGIWNLTSIGDIFRSISAAPLLGIGGLIVIFSLVFVGFMLGFGLIAKWMPGEGAAEKKMGEIQKKLTVFSAPLGLASIVGGVILLVFYITH